MSAPRFVNELPPEAPRNRRGRGPSKVIETLRRNPGRWAEVGRYPVERREAAQQRSAYIKKRYADIEATCRTVGAEVLVFARSIEVTT